MKSLFLLAMLAFFLFSCRREENLSLQLGPLNTIDTLLERVVQNDTNGVIRTQTNSFYRYDNLKRLISINSELSSTTPSMLPPYIENTSVQYSGANMLPVSSFTSHRELVNGVASTVFDSTLFFYIYDNQNRKITDSVVKGSFNSTTSNFTIKSTYVAKYSYAGAIIYGVSNETSVLGNDVKYDTAYLDANGNIGLLNSTEYKSSGYYAKSTGSYSASFDMFKNPYQRFVNIYLRIPVFMNSNISHEAMGLNNVKSYGTTIYYLPMNAIACGSDIHNYVYPQNSLYPQEYRAPMLGLTKRFYYKII